MPPLRVAHVITTLETGGAEVMLSRLLSALSTEAYESRVYSLTAGGRVREWIERRGIPVVDLDMHLGRPDPRGVNRLAKHLRRHPPQVLQTWMYHADLVGSAAACLLGKRIPIAWGIHNTTFHPDSLSPLTRAVLRSCALGSHWVPDRIICCSNLAKELHIRYGYRQDRIEVIPNGFDLAAYQPRPERRPLLRQLLGLGDEVPLVGLIARFDPQKGHRFFVQASQRLHRERPDVHFVLCGRGITAENQVLTSWIKDAGIDEVCHLLGERTDVPDIMAGLDLVCSSSVGEAMPLVVGEAMASGVLCVVTDVGDSALLVGDTGRVVPPADPAALAAALAEILALDPAGAQRLRLAGRARIESCFSIGAVAERYGTVWRQLHDRSSRR